MTCCTDGLVKTAKPEPVVSDRGARNWLRSAVASMNPAHPYPQIAQIKQSSTSIYRQQIARLSDIAHGLR